MKKLLAVILTLAMIFSLSVTAVFAEEDTDNTDSPDVPIEQAVAEENGFADFDLDPSHYASAAAFANAVLSEAETYGQTKKALALLQTAYAVWPNPRLIAAANALTRSQWKLILKSNTDEDGSLREYWEYECNDAGDQIREIWYENAAEWEEQYKNYTDGTEVQDFVVRQMVDMRYDVDHHLILMSGVNGWQDEGLITAEEIADRLQNGLVNNRNRYTYNDAGRMTGQYYTQADGTEFLTDQYEYDDTGCVLLRRIQYWGGELSGSTEYSYDENGSQSEITYYNQAEEEIYTDVLSYDEYGQLIQRDRYKNNVLVMHAEYQYQANGERGKYLEEDYDDSGENVTMSEERSYDEYGHTLSLYNWQQTMGVQEYYCEYEYNDDGVMLMDQTFDPDGSLRGAYCTYEYRYYELSDRGDTELSEYWSGDYKYCIMPDGTAKITRCYSDEEILTVPAALDGFTVSAIGEGAFFQCEQLTEIVIPDSITVIEGNPAAYCEQHTRYTVSLDHPTLAVIDGVLFSKADKRLIAYPSGKADTSYAIPQGIAVIGAKAFYECMNLTEVTIPDSVREIGDCAFWVCDNITEITIPDSATLFGANPFFAGIGLREIKVSSDHPVLEVTDGVLFDKVNRTLICYPCGKEGSVYEVPDGTRTIGADAFCNCDYLMAITVPDSVTEMGEAAFAELAGPVVVDLGNGITEISDDAFKFSGVTKVTLPSGLKQIGEDAFSDSGISDITFPDGLETIGSGAFWGCHKLEKVDIPDSVTEIAEYAFGWCSGLTELKLPAGLSEISPAAFSSCSSLTTIDLPDTVKVIGEGAFSGCGLTSIDIPDSVTELGSHAFSGCSFTSVALPEGITEIGEETFQSCSDLTEVLLPDSLTRIGSSAFAYCYALTDLVLPESVTEIGEEAFYLCQSLSGIEIPDNVTRIRERSFQGCESLRNIALPEGLASIEHGAFWDCVSLGTVTIPESVSFIDDRVFSGCGDITLIVERDSYAQEYCIEQGLNYLYSDSLDWLND